MIGVGIVGMGNIGRRHLGIIESFKEFDVKGYNNLIEFSDLNLTYFKSLDALLEDESIEVVSICTPNGLHAKQAIKCLEAGKHVLIEKPLATSKKDCEAIIAASLHQSKYVFCMMQNRCSPISQELKKIITEKVLGKIYMIDVRCFWNRDKGYYSDPEREWRGSIDLDGGTLFTQFAHYVDLLYWLFGDIQVTNAQFKNANHGELIEFEDTGVFSFQTSQKSIGTFQYSTSIWDKNFESTLTIIGENGTLKVGGQYMNKIEYCHLKNYEFPGDLSVNNIENMSNVYQNILDVLNHKKNVTTNALDGLKVVEIIEKIYSYKS